MGADGTTSSATLGAVGRNGRGETVMVESRHRGDLPHVVTIAGEPCSAHATHAEALEAARLATQCATADAFIWAQIQTQKHTRSFGDPITDFWGEDDVALELIEEYFREVSADDLARAFARQDDVDYVDDAREHRGLLMGGVR